MLDAEVKIWVPSSAAVTLRGQRRSCCRRRINSWTQRKVVARTTAHTKPRSECRATCPASRMPRSFERLPRAATFGASCWRPKPPTCVRRNMRFMCLGAGSLATQCSTSPIQHAPGCLGISIAWWKCSASSSASVGQSACASLASRLRKRVPACGLGKPARQTEQSRHDIVAYCQKGSIRRRRSDAPQ